MLHLDIKYIPMQPSTQAKIHFFSATSVEIDTHLFASGWQKYRGQQLRQIIYGKMVTDAADFIALPIDQRQRMSDVFELLTGRIATRQNSADGTLKLLLEWPNDSNAEAVMIPDSDRRTACVSSQVGCPVGCRFCASGVNGVKGNLTAGQIIEQVFTLNRLLNLSQPGGRITNVVFMGMGEPLANYGNVLQAVRIMNDDGCLNLGARRITISTVGVPAKMRQLARESLAINLALSLHAPTESLRRQLIPWAEHFPLPEILDAARDYFDQTGREITLEYILLAGVNDQADQAIALAKLCKTLRANINLIRYNAVPGLPYQRPLSRDVMIFQRILRDAGVNAHLRKSRGRDIDAACGQLRRKEAGASHGQADPFTPLTVGGTG